MFTFKTFGCLLVLGFMTLLAYWDEKIQTQNQKHIWPQDVFSPNCFIWIKGKPTLIFTLEEQKQQELLKSLKAFEYQKRMSTDQDHWSEYGIDPNRPAFECGHRKLYLGDLSLDRLTMYFGTEDGRVYLGGKQLGWIIDRFSSP